MKQFFDVSLVAHSTSTGSDLNGAKVITPHLWKRFLGKKSRIKGQWMNVKDFNA